MDFILTASWNERDRTQISGFTQEGFYNKTSFHIDVEDVEL